MVILVLFSTKISLSIITNDQYDFLFLSIALIVLKKDPITYEYDVESNCAVTGEVNNIDFIKNSPYTLWDVIIKEPASIYSKITGMKKREREKKKTTKAKNKPELFKND